MMVAAQRESDTSDPPKRQRKLGTAAIPRQNHARKYGLHRLLPEPLLRAVERGNGADNDPKALIMGFNEVSSSTAPLSPSEQTRSGEKTAEITLSPNGHDDRFHTNNSFSHQESEPLQSYLSGKSGSGERSRLFRDREMERDTEIEAFLDEHAGFLEEYVTKKVPRSVLERWLFQPTARKGERSLDPKAKATKQRSRSFTPLRKLSSASEFEEGGLETPILVKSFDGSPSFLRTNSNSSINNLSNGYNMTRRKGQGQMTMPCPKLLVSEEEATRVEQAAREQRLLDLAEDLVREGSRSRQESEVTEGQGRTDVVKKLTVGLRDLFRKADHISIFLKRSGGNEGSLVGDLFTMSRDDLDVEVEVKTPSLNRLMTGAMMSRSTFRSSRKNSGKRPDLKVKGQNVESIVICPLVDEERNCESLGVLQLASFDPECEEFFSARDYGILERVQRFASLALTHQRKTSETRLELARSEVFLELARTIFEEQGRIEPTIASILANFLTMIDCERCQIILLEDAKPDDENGNHPVFKRVFDLERKDLKLDEDRDDETFEEDEKPLSDLVFEGRFPINIAITGEVATTGKTINIRDAHSDQRCVRCSF